jgi:AraC-like DNA-binding protein
MALPQNPDTVSSLFDDIDPLRRGMGIFKYIKDVCYFVKDNEGRFVAANDATLVLLGCSHEHELLGKTDYELVAAYLADLYYKDDRDVIERGKSIVNKVELVTRDDLSVFWSTTTKIPLFDKSGNIIGLEGTTREFKAASSALGPFPELSIAIDYVEAHYAEKITVAQLAEISGMQLRTFERQFKKRFNLSPIAFIKKVRINAACRDLIHTDHSLTHIASDAGFCDQSYMTREFARIMKVTPQVYRDAHTA